MTVITALQARVTVAPTEATGTRSISDIAASLVSSESSAAAEPTSTSHRKPASDHNVKDKLSESVIAFIVVGLVALFLMVFVIRTIYICKKEKITMKQYFSSCFGRRDKTTRRPKVRDSNAVQPSIPIHLPSMTTGDGIDAYGRRIGDDVKDAHELPGYDGTTYKAPPAYPSHPSS